MLAQGVDRARKPVAGAPQLHAPGRARAAAPVPEMRGAEPGVARGGIAAARLDCSDAVHDKETRARPAEIEACRISPQPN
jgi:hypothetical protein